jgi:hypothetical protein
VTINIILGDKLRMKKEKRISVRVTEEEYNKIRSEAKLWKMKLSDLCRFKLLELSTAGSSGYELPIEKIKYILPMQCLQLEALEIYNKLNSHVFKLPKILLKRKYSKKDRRAFIEWNNEYENLKREQKAINKKIEKHYILFRKLPMK